MCAVTMSQILKKMCGNFEKLRAPPSDILNLFDFAFISMIMKSLRDCICNM